MFVKYHVDDKKRFDSYTYHLIDTLNRYVTVDVSEDNNDGFKQALEEFGIDYINDSEFYTNCSEF